MSIVLLVGVLILAGALARPAASAPPATVSIYLPMVFKAFALDTQVTIKSFAFTPKDITVAAGTRVVWTNQETSPVNHTVTSGAPGVPSGVFDSGALAPGQVFSVTFSTSGTFAYFCRIHGAAMTGTITVTP